MSIRIKFTEPWQAVDDTRAKSLAAELQRELSAGHPLFGQTVATVALRYDCDDVLFSIGRTPERFAVVHLTWAGKRDCSPQWPRTEMFDTLDQFVERRMRQDSVEHGRSA